MKTILWFGLTRVSVQRHVVGCAHLNRGVARLLPDTQDNVDYLIERGYAITDAPCTKKAVAK